MQISADGVSDVQLRHCELGEESLHVIWKTDDEHLAVDAELVRERVGRHDHRYGGVAFQVPGSLADEAVELAEPREGCIYFEVLDDGDRHLGA